MHLTFVTCGPEACAAAGCRSLCPGVRGGWPPGPGTGSARPVGQLPAVAVSKKAFKPKTYFYFKTNMDLSWHRTENFP